jgi:2-phospho-L-lactate guanylyltransferase
MMKTFAIVPVKRFENAKTRLSSMLDTEDRIRLSSLMLEDTLQILSVAPPLTQVIIVSADKRADEIATKHGAKFLPEEKEKMRPLLFRMICRFLIQSSFPKHVSSLKKRARA